MSHVLDRPIWNALATSHAALAQGGALARRYPPAIVPFAATVDQTAESATALARLPQPGETMAIVETYHPEVPSGLELVRRDELVQMLGAKAFARIEDARIVRLTPADAGEMLQLASLTRPGPFTLGAQDLGAFWGIRRDGRLAAMAGQRLRVPGFGELSGLCTHPDFRGQGLARALFAFVAGEISARGDTPFLHAYASHRNTIALYERLGFEVRAEMRLTMLQRPA